MTMRVAMKLATRTEALPSRCQSGSGSLEGIFGPQSALALLWPMQHSGERGAVISRQAPTNHSNRESNLVSSLMLLFGADREQCRE